MEVAGLPVDRPRLMTLGCVVLVPPTSLRSFATQHFRIVGRERRSWHSRPLFARFYGLLSRRADAGELGARRAALLARARGAVLDVGAGPGDTFKHLSAAVTRFIALEPDPAMVVRGRRRGTEAPVPPQLVRGLAEGLPFPGETFDTVLVALVLCTVEDPRGALAEIHRVLRPGGRLLLMEHVRAQDPVLAKWQDRLQPLWSRCNGGCRPNRATLEMIQAAGFRFRTLDAYGFPVLPHVQAEAVRQ